jgi:hypothetical protein
MLLLCERDENTVPCESGVVPGLTPNRGKSVERSGVIEPELNRACWSNVCRANGYRVVEPPGHREHVVRRADGRSHGVWSIT